VAPRTGWTCWLVATALCFQLAGEAVAQSTLVVDDARDLPDAVRDGSCATAEGTCTLRAALDELNVIEPPVARVELPAGRYHLTAGPLKIRKQVELRGAGPSRTTIDAQGLFRVVEVFTDEGVGYEDVPRAEPTVHIRDVALVNGVSVEGGGLWIFESRVALDRVWILDNLASRDGGGIFTDFSSLIARDVVVAHNRAGRNGGAIQANQAVVERSTLSNNEAALFGGGIHTGSLGAIWGHTRVVASLIEGNIAGESGGGVASDSLELIESTLRDNRALAGGGATMMAGRIVRSTLSGNEAQDLGGGLYAEPASEAWLELGLPGTINLASSTLSSNQADAGGGLAMEGGPHIELSIESTTIANNDAFLAAGLLWIGGAPTSSSQRTVVAGNRGGDCAGGRPLARGRNHDGDGSCGAPVSGAADLSPLGDWGGPTETHLPSAGSALVDAGGPSCLARDQRRFARPLDGDGDGIVACDIGSVERAPGVRRETCEDVTPYFGGPWLGPLCLGYIERVQPDFQIEIPRCFADGPGCWGGPDAFRMGRQAMAAWGLEWRPEHEGWFFAGFAAVDRQLLAPLLEIRGEDLWLTQSQRIPSAVDREGFGEQESTAHGVPGLFEAVPLPIR